MLPGSHMVPIINPASESLHSPQLLADAFSEFISASSLLEESYRDLQREVAHLGIELAERNAALTRSLSENDHMRAALQQMIDSMPCGVLVLDTADSIVTINPEGRRLLELGTQEVRSLRDLDAISKLNLASLVDGGYSAEESAVQVDHEFCMRLARGKRWLAISNRKLSCGSANYAVDKHRPALQSIWIFRDMTATRQAEQEREATRNATALAEVSTILAHEIRNPLASMELFAGLIIEDRENIEVWVSHLRAGIRLLSATVNNVLSIHGGSNAHLVPVDLNDCIRGGVEFVRPIAEQAGVDISCVTADNDPKIQGNENLLRQILLNLVCNAIRHTPAGGTVTVSTGGACRNGAKVALVNVTDSGCGISKHQLNRVFDAGFSATGDTPGLGLAVCHRLMVLHGGQIRVASQMHCGSTFELEFPVL